MLLFLFFTLPILLRIFHSGFFVSDDASWMIIRFSAFYETLRSGEFPVRWLDRLNNGFGYPVSHFAYPGFLYLGIPFRVIGLSYVTIIKIIFGLSVIGSAVFTFLWLSTFFEKRIAFFGSLLYIYSPYFLFDLFKRGSIGEMLALCCVPFVLWNIEKKRKLFIGLGMGMLLLSHNILALLFTPFIVLYALIHDWRPFSFRHFSHTLLPIIVGIGSAAFFWLPAMSDLSLIIFSSTEVSEWKNYFSDIALIGYGSLTSLVLSIVFLYNVRKKITLYPFFFLATALGAVIGSISISTIVWENIPAYFIQFPFRLLAIFIISTAYLTCFVLSIQKKQHVVWIGMFLFFLSLLSSYQYLVHITYEYKEEGFYSTNMSTTTTKDEYMPRWVKKKPDTFAFEKAKIASGEGKLLYIKSTAKELSLNASMKTPGKIEIQKIYFPGWQLSVNEKQQPIDYKNSQGIMTFSLPKGESTITLMFNETPAWLLADFISIASLVTLFFL